MGGQKGIAFFNRYMSRISNLICVTTRDNMQISGEGYIIKNILGTSSLRYVNPLYFFKLKKIIKEEQISYLILEHPYFGWLGFLLKRICKIKLVVHSHNIESLRFKSMNKWWWGILWNYEKRVHRNADISFFIHDEDRNYAIENFKLNPAKCTIITYGFELDKPPTVDEKESARQQICKNHQIDPSNRILLFNGTLGYKPNLDALDTILQKINPILLADAAFKYKVVICGNKLPAIYNGLTAYREKNIIYAGFVDDINLYFKGADIFINPVIDGGGIKTKVVEALGYNLSVISTQSGAIGIPQAITGDKLSILEDCDWDGFANQIISKDYSVHIKERFFDHFYWGNIAERAKTAIM